MEKYYNAFLAGKFIGNVWAVSDEQAKSWAATKYQITVGQWSDLTVSLAETAPVPKGLAI